MKIIGWILAVLIVYSFINRKKQKPLSPEEQLRIQQEQEKQKKAQEMARKQQILEEKEADERRKKEEELRLQKIQEAELAKVSKLLDSPIRVYFSYSFVSENSSLYLIDEIDNSVLQSFVTTASKLYKEGYRLRDADKTGQSAQLDSMNFILRFQKD